MATKRIHADDNARKRAWRKANPEKNREQVRASKRRRREREKLAREKMERAPPPEADTSAATPGERGAAELPAA